MTPELLKELLDYDAKTGVFKWKKRRGRGIAGAIAGRISTSTTAPGYVQIMVSRKLYQAHRLAWLHVHGSMPYKQIDHINGIRSDNRIANLRLVNGALNSQNQRRARKDNKTGFLGVSLHRSRFQACIRKDRKIFHLGYFDSAKEAHEAYVKAKRAIHEGNTL